MINLLPPEHKESITFARKNTKLLHLATVLVFVMIGTLGFVGVGHLYLASATSRYKAQAEETRQTLQEQDLEATKKQMSELSNSINLVLDVLSKEVLFSKLLQQAGSVMPSGSVLSGIEISKVSGGIDLSAEAQNYQTATQVQVNLEDPDNKLFEKVDIVKVNCGGNEASQQQSQQNSSRYPCSIDLRALFADDNPYLFINDGKDS